MSKALPKVLAIKPSTMSISLAVKTIFNLFQAILHDGNITYQRTCTINILSSPSKESILLHHWRHFKIWITNFCDFSEELLRDLNTIDVTILAISEHALKSSYVMFRLEKDHIDWIGWFLELLVGDMLLGVEVFQFAWQVIVPVLLALGWLNHFVD